MNPDAHEGDDLSQGRVFAVYLVVVALVIGGLIGLERFAGIDINRSFLTAVGIYLILAVWWRPAWAWDFASMQVWRRMLGDRGATILWGAAGGAFLYLGLFTHVRLFK